MLFPVKVSLLFLGSVWFLLIEVILTDPVAQLTAGGPMCLLWLSEAHTGACSRAYHVGLLRPDLNQSAEAKFICCLPAQTHTDQNISTHPEKLWFLSAVLYLQGRGEELFSSDVFKAA